jgi:hypothetical protein
VAAEPNPLPDFHEPGRLGSGPHAMNRATAVADAANSLPARGGECYI